jgi:NAD-dependent SIR2 family protein deacetylase
MSVAIPEPTSIDETLPSADDVSALRRFFEAHSRVFVLTGAGCSTESGIPDYRAADGSWKRSQPVQFSAFMHDPDVRARYWARSLVGWRRLDSAQPNHCHRALARLERSGRVSLLATQNVDGLHQAAGSRRIVDLHGRIDRIVCTSCGQTGRRDGWQRRLASLNRPWSRLTAPAAPDGDAELDRVDFTGFRVPPCVGCGGIVKPDVVFFGERVPVWRHAQAMAALETSDAVLVVGSSLMVQSGYRYARAASRLGRPIAAVNLGVTRADTLLAIKVCASAGATLGAL